MSETEDTTVVVKNEPPPPHAELPSRLSLEHNKARDSIIGMVTGLLTGTLLTIEGFGIDIPDKAEAGMSQLVLGALAFYLWYKRT